MLPHADRSTTFARRPDRSLGWAAMEAKQALALARLLSPEAPTAKRRLRAAELARRVLAWLLALQLCYLAATSLLILVYRRVDPPVTVLMAYRKWAFGWELKPPRPVKLAKLPRYLKSMLVAIEDGKFYEHHGLDFEAFQRAREINKRLGRRLYGGSTLTMQVARTLFLVPEKSYVRKYLEVLTALELEAFLPKARILELYFGYAEWGKGLFGIEAAARRWYGRGVSELSRDEAARLVALLSSPIKYGPDTLRKSGILRERYEYLSNRYDQPQEAAPGPSPEAASEAAPGAATSAGPEAALPPSAELPAEGGATAAASEATAPPPAIEPGAEEEHAEP
jgi:monofunctional glycosyltransferase